jgi:hypothetical protein
VKRKTKRTSKKAAWAKIRLRLPDLDQAKAAVLNIFYLLLNITSIWDVSSA